jgi:iron complex outermembrane recepter protein
MMKKMHRKKLSLAVAQALSAGIFVGLAAPSAYAQQPPAPVERIEKFNVTGSRIPAPNLESSSPITQITARDIKFEAPVSTENLLNNLPQVFADQGNMLSNGATGTANLNLRGLGSVRTLVLVNGRRLPPGDPQIGGYPPDVNMIPAQLIQRVEILTGGASAVYGSDAIAGVVNFIMNDRFEGVQIDVNHSFYNHDQHSPIKGALAASAATATIPSQFATPGDASSDGEVEDYSILMGGNFANGKGNATVFLGFHKQRPLLQGQRDFSACAIGSTGSGFVCLGSSTAFPGRFRNAGGGSNFTIADAAGNVRPYSSTTDAFNFAPFNHFQVPDDRWTADAFVHYDIDPRARVYAEFGFMDDHSPRAIAPSGAFFGGFGQEFLLSASNPLLSTSFKNAFGITSATPGDLFIGRRDIEGGPRINDLRHTDYRYVVGVKGEAFKGWDYDVYYQQGKSLLQIEYFNDFSVAKMQRALNVVTNPALPSGPPVCASNISGADPTCVPWDIFHLGGVTTAAVNFLATPGFQNGSTEQSIYGATLGADFGVYGWRSPWAKNGIGVSFGAERRVEKLTFNNDEEFKSGDLAGQGGQGRVDVHGQVQVSEYFAEVRVPIIEDRPWAQYLAVNGSYRYSDYDIGKTSNTYGFGVEWNPVKEVKLRASSQQTVRAPNIIELFSPQFFNLFNLSADPCGGPKGATATLEQCLRTGLLASQFGNPDLTNSAGQYNNLQGGNPTLDPETGKSFTAGVVWVPNQNFSGSIDYFKIKVSNVIFAGIPATQSLQLCLTQGLLCNLINRDPRTGALWTGSGFVSQTNLNLAKLETSGVDFSANYRQPLPGAWGSISAEFIGTYLQDLKTDLGLGQGPYDCAGLYGTICGGPAPKWRHKLRGTWSTPWNVDLSVAWRHIDKVKQDATDSNPQLAAEFNPEDAELGQRDYFDIAGAWAITKQFTLWAGVSNVFDRDPPLTSVGSLPFFNGNTFPQSYDALGRHFFITLSAKF